jgi:hypothetical protein
MFAVTVTRETRAVGVLLGGTGHARMPTRQGRPLAALLKPLPFASQEACGDEENRAAGDGPC